MLFRSRPSRKPLLIPPSGGQLADFRAARAVDLKPGAQVMLLTNLDPGAKLANGSLGRVLRWEEVARDLRVKGGEWGSMEWAAQKAEEWLEGQKSGRWLPVVEFDCGVVSESFFEWGGGKES